MLMNAFRRLFGDLIGLVKLSFCGGKVFSVEALLSFELPSSTISKMEDPLTNGSLRFQNRQS